MTRFRWLKDPETRGFVGEYHGLVARVDPEPGLGWQWTVKDRDGTLASGTSWDLTSAKGRAYDVTRGEYLRQLIRK